MAGSKRSHAQADSGSSSPAAKGRPTATVFRKSAKKARLDKDSSTSNAKGQPGSSSSSSDVKKKPKQQPSQPPRPRPRDQPKPKTKHEFIQQKKAQAQAERDQERLAQAKKDTGPARKTKSGAASQASNGGVKSGAGKKVKPAPAPPALVLPPPPSPATSFRIVAGSYERLLYGLQASLGPAPASASASSKSKSRDDAPPSLSVTLKPYFIFPAHVSAIRTLACGPAGSRWLATGGTDELIKIWDLKKRVEVGALTGHEGTITSLSFPSRTYLISTGTDGRINIFRARDWALLRTLKGHTGPIHSAAIHPSGRLALSVGKDRTIRMWDLMRAKGAASTKLGVEGELIRWDSRGERFVVLSSTGAGEGMVFRTDMTRLHALEGLKRLHDVQFVRARMAGPLADSASASKTKKNGKAGVNGQAEEKGEDDDGVHAVEHELMLVASEDKSVHVFDLDASALDELEREQARAKARAAAGGDQDADEEEDEEEAVPLVEIGRLVGHTNRVKAVAVQHVIIPSPSSPQEATTTTETTLLATTISSDGHIRVFDLAPLLHLRPQDARARPSGSAGTTKDGSSLAAEAGAVPELKPIAEHDTKGSRLTCLAVAPGGGGGSAASGAGASAAADGQGSKGKGRTLGHGQDGEQEEDDGEDDDDEDEGEDYLGSDLDALDSDDSDQDAHQDDDADADEDEDDLDVDLEAEAEELARLEKEIEEARKAGLEIPSDLEGWDGEDQEEDEEDGMESFDEGSDGDGGEEEEEGEDEEEGEEEEEEEE